MTELLILLLSLWGDVGTDQSPGVLGGVAGDTEVRSARFSSSVMSNSLLLHESQHTRPRCPSSTPRVHSNSCSLSQWCHPAISSSVVCRETAWEFPPMTKVMWRGSDMQRRIRTQEAPWTCPSIYPKTKIFLFYYFMTFTNSSDINRGLSPTTFLCKKVNLKL